MQTEISILMDLVLAASVAGLGWAAVTSSESERAVVWFIALGLLLAAVAVLLRLAGTGGATVPAAAIVRWFLVSGVGICLTVGLLVGIGDRAFLHYPVAWSGVLILLIETFATLFIAAALALTYIGGRAGRSVPRSNRSTPRGCLHDTGHRIDLCPRRCGPVCLGYARRFAAAVPVTADR